jgi:hypothetical protein
MNGLRAPLAEPANARTWMCVQVSPAEMKLRHGWQCLGADENLFVIPAQAGIQFFFLNGLRLSSCAPLRAKLAVARIEVVSSVMSDGFIFFAGAKKTQPKESTLKAKPFVSFLRRIQ